VKRRSLFIGLALAAVLAAVLVGRGLASRKPTGPAAPAAAPAASAAQQALDLAPGDVAQALKAPLTSTLAISGGIRAQRSAIVKAKVAGELKTLLVREGDTVRAGQPLGQIDATEYQWRLKQAEDQALAAKAQLDIAERTLENNRALVNQGFISKNALDASVSSAAGAAASLQAARAAAEIARKAVGDAQVIAPIPGLVSQRLVQPGERVPLDGRIVEIVDLSRLELEAQIAPEDVVSLRVGQAAALQVDGLAQPIAAKVVRINPSAQAGSRAVLAYLELAPDAAAQGVRQGLFARGSIELTRREALVVPVSALRFDQAKPYVLVVEGGKAVARTVGTGARGDVAAGGKTETAVEITSGLEPGAAVLRGTVGALREGTLVKLPPQAQTVSR
jgi:membrane fusion protein, multidrug efflux system